MLKLTKKILLIDDEQPIAETITAYAKKENFEIIYADNGENGLEKIKNDHFDLVILDWMLPGLTGPDIIKKIREGSNIPILMISARNDETDIVVGLEVGADDYVTKPFGPRELMARIHSLLRRTHTETVDDENVNIGELSIHFAKKEIRKGGRIVEFTPIEFRIIEELASQRGKVVSREALMVKALGYREFLNDRTLDTHIKNIRKKIEDDPQQPQIIKTVRESGFKFCIPSDL